MNRLENPFNDLWLTERLRPEEFVRVFSPVVAEQAEGLFSTGNVVVRGRQGSGKSMLLGLLATSTRVAYARSGEQYPSPKDMPPFIAAGTNVIRDNVQIITSRLDEVSSASRESWLAATFADYLNYILVEDLLGNIEYLNREQAKDGVLSDVIVLDWSSEAQSRALEALKASDVWSGYFDNCETMGDFSKSVSQRLVLYRRYFNFNSELDDKVAKSKTQIAEPIACLAECLRQAGVIPANASVFLRIDQHEELHALEQKTRNSGVFRRVINRALALRDKRVSYRVGTRHYAWSDELKIWGSGAPLENLRDYTVIDIDDILRRRENSSHSAFNDFAEDVLRRRLLAHGYEGVPESNVIRSIFGSSIAPSERAKIYARNRDFSGFGAELRSDSWNKKLSRIWSESPLDAKLGDAWLRQRNQVAKGVGLKNADEIGEPWLDSDREWWRKERNELALMQIAGDARQSLIWCGDRQFVSLAGWNILAFMSICQKTWSAWLRKSALNGVEDRSVPAIDIESQTIGVLDASKEWMDKIREGSDGEDRRKIIDALGRWFGRVLRADKAMSYPGHNGISLTEEDFLSGGAISKLIKECRDHGDLIESSHTTKSGDGLARIKWYLNPVLCPYFRIPHIRTKEPIYTTVDQIRSILEGEREEASDANDDNVIQPGLF
ncbi:hypothetical protein [Xanthomonas tesorieronis]|uniref:ORC-CDC6 family AAA ATPase n=1 Tax=Xanthomonas tesorieronis TaxID=3160839 RepID=UPI003516A4B7